MSDGYDQNLYLYKRSKLFERLVVGLISICLFLLSALLVVSYQGNTNTTECFKLGQNPELGIPQSPHLFKNYHYYDNDGYDDEDFVKGDPLWASDFPGMSEDPP